MARTVKKVGKQEMLISKKKEIKKEKKKEEPPEEELDQIRYLGVKFD